MQELQKILKEIEAEFDRRIETQLKLMAGLSDDVYRYGHGKSLEAYQQGKLFVQDIIQKHMNDGWIPVEERLPEKEYDTVLCVTDKNYYLVCVYNKEIGFRTSDLGMEGEIVAWRPLPDLYPEQITKLQKGSRWISVKEKLPENNNDVFVKTLEGNTSIGWYNSSLEVWFVNDKQENIIAWREKHGLFN